MRYSNIQTTWQEVPNEFSLVFSIVGCPLACKGCHSAKTWNSKSGKALTVTLLEQYINQYRDYISCVCFLGGEWHEQQLIEYLQRIRHAKLKTCLYTGLSQCLLSQTLINQLDYLKTGSWQAKLGGLDSPRSNQRFFDLNTHSDLTHVFRRN